MELNHRRPTLQAGALPTELPRHGVERWVRSIVSGPKRPRSQIELPRHKLALGDRIELPFRYAAKRYRVLTLNYPSELVEVTGIEPAT